MYKDDKGTMKGNNCNFSPAENANYDYMKGIKMGINASNVSMGEKAIYPKAERAKMDKEANLYQYE